MPGNKLPDTPLLTPAAWRGGRGAGRCSAPGDGRVNAPRDARRVLPWLRALPVRPRSWRAAGSRARSPRRRHLSIEVEVRPVGENKGGRGITGPTEPTHLDDAARGRRVGKGIDPALAHVVGTTVDAVDHGVGLADQFVMRSGGDEAPDDGRRSRAVGRRRDGAPADRPRPDCPAAGR
jgi:hypothetical protein